MSAPHQWQLHSVREHHSCIASSGHAHISWGCNLHRSWQDRGEGLSAKAEEQMCFEIKTILLAGHETSAAMLTWTLMELTKNPDALQKVKTLPSAAISC